MKAIVQNGDYRFFSEKKMADMEQQARWLDDSPQIGGTQ